MMDSDVHLLLGEINGRLAALTEAFEDERNLRRQESRATLQKFEELDQIQADLASMRSAGDVLQRQTYSTKAEVDKVKEDVATVKSIYSKIMGVIITLGTIASMIMTGVWWAFSHWNEIYAFVKGVSGGKP